ncbi:hypothetical protein BB561_001170 [Smittium simulii]|uniref:Cyclin N-terminal domain-containing protein n=1 Tax=Smittium simulii TaxID=133385 RepID=A0A2T9YVU4_9FUNG|nr:hypothetical protein BB561_001170 [Smittium simulii]
MTLQNVLNSLNSTVTIESANLQNSFDPIILNNSFLKSFQKRSLSEYNTDTLQTNTPKRLCIKNLVNQIVSTSQNAPPVLQNVLKCNPNTTHFSSKQIDGICSNKNNNSSNITSVPSVPSLATPNYTPYSIKIKNLVHLYDISCSIIQNIWPNHSTSNTTQICSLKSFVVETHQKSRLPPQILELALYYLIQIKPLIQNDPAALDTACISTKIKNPHKNNLNLSNTHFISNSASEINSYYSCNKIKNLDPTQNTPANVTPALSLPSSTNSSLNSEKFSRPFKYTSNSISPLSSTFCDNFTNTTQSSNSNEFKRSLTRNSSMYNFKQACKPNSKIINRRSNTLNVRQDSKLPAEQKKKCNISANTQIQLNKIIQADIIKCGRRMFVAALICASKFSLDCAISNKVWNRITNLPNRQISCMEISFLKLIKYNLYVDKLVFQQWSIFLQRCTPAYARIIVPDTLISSLPNLKAIIANIPSNAQNIEYRSDSQPQGIHPTNSLNTIFNSNTQSVLPLSSRTSLQYYKKNIGNVSLPYTDKTDILKLAPISTLPNSKICKTGAYYSPPLFNSATQVQQTHLKNLTNLKFNSELVPLQPQTLPFNNNGLKSIAGFPKEHARLDYKQISSKSPNVKNEIIAVNPPEDF